MLARVIAPLKQYHDELESRAAELALQVEAKTQALARLRGDEDHEEDESLSGWEEDEPPVRDLFTPAMMPSSEAVLASALQKTSLDLAAMAREHADDPLAFAKLVNYIRRCRAAGETDSAVVSNVRGGRWRDDANAKPFDVDDALLWWDPFEASADDDDDDDEAAATLLERAEEAHAELVAAASSAASGAPLSVARAPPSSDYYYASYSHIDIHEEMLRDTARTLAYKNALTNLDGLVVVDVGCGTGVLSMFSAKAGAKEVIAIEASDMAGVAAKLVELNGLSDRVKVLKGRAEDVVEGADVQADVIVSEWMGYALFYESMLESVLCVRDAWLKKRGGKMYPDRAVLYIEAVRDAEGRLSFWDEVYGLDFAPLKDVRRQGADVLHVASDWLVSGRAELCAFDLQTVMAHELDFTAAFELDATDEVAGLCVSFATSFPGGGQVLSTTPDATPTHWKQTVLWLPRCLPAGKVAGTLSYARRYTSNERQLDLALELRLPAPQPVITYRLD